MSRGLLFWILYLLALIGYFVNFWPFTPFAFGASVIVFILLGLLAWQVFGPPLHG